MNKIIEEKLELFWNFIKNINGVMALIISGSYTIDYIVNKHDIDIIYIAKDLPSLHKATKYIKNNLDIKNILNDLKQYNVFIHGATSKVFDLYLIYAYEFKKSTTVLFGELELPDIDILKNKEKYIANCKIRFNFFKNKYLNENYTSKNLYHILTGMYIIQNNSYELTNQQINKINIIHDCSDINEWINCFNEIENWLNTFDIDIESFVEQNKTKVQILSLKSHTNI